MLDMVNSDTAEGYGVIGLLSGDASGDFAMTSNDAMIVLHYSLGAEMLDDTSIEFADVNNYGTVYSAVGVCRKSLLKRVGFF